jgi:glycosyltransferase involved in cell wall biosynthesis
VTARRALGRVRRSCRIAGMALTPARGGVYYGHRRVPAPGELAWGGWVKLQVLGSVFPNTPRGWRLLYACSSTPTPELPALLRLAARRRAPLIWNQNGVATPAWREDYMLVNREIARGLRAADHVLFQSGFCRMSTELFVGLPSCGSEILYNPVDTQRFVPRERRRDGLEILVAGNQHVPEALEAALRAFAIVAAREPGARLVVAGRVGWSGDPGGDEREARRLAAALGVAGRVGWRGTYTQAEAPALFAGADVLLFPTVNAPCPTTVLEAIACGLPVVYASPGGTVELVGPEAGIAVDAPLSWDVFRTPDPEALADAVLRLAADLDPWAEAARRRAVESFDLRPWLERHRRLFSELLEGPG